MIERDNDRIVGILLEQNKTLHAQIAFMQLNKRYLLNHIGQLREENKKLKAKKWYWPFN